MEVLILTYLPHLHTLLTCTSPFAISPQLFQSIQTENTALWQILCSGASIPPETMMHFCHLFQIPPYFRNFLDSVENFLNFTYFPYFSTFSLCFAKIIISPPTFQNFP